MVINLFSSSSKSSGSLVSSSSLWIKLFNGCVLNGNESQAVLGDSEVGVGGPGPVNGVAPGSNLVIEDVGLGNGNPGGVLGVGGLCDHLGVGLGAGVPGTDG